MSNENNTILGIDVNLICEFFLNTERQGPGSPEVTLKALSFIDHLTDHSRIADLGCGTGGQTMTLARYAPGQITGLDFFPGFVERFNHNARELNLQERVKGIVGSMDALPFGEEELDLIWSEGAIYNIGFERGLNEWRKYLKTGGYVTVSESSWFTEERPAEIHFTPLVKAREIFSRKYAGNKTVEELISFQHHEAELYRKYKEFYGYVFYIAKKMK